MDIFVHYFYNTIVFNLAKDIGKHLCCWFSQPQLRLYGVDGRYAHALYSAASKDKKLEAVEKDLKSFQVT